MFLRHDGFGLLGATERIGDFSLGLTSEKIKDDALNFYEGDSANYCSLVIANKNQYRVFKYDSAVDRGDAEGLIAVQRQVQDPSSFEWGTLQGFLAYRAYSTSVNTDDVSLIVNNDGYVYKLEQSSRLAYADGFETMTRRFNTPYLSLGDPTVRKQLHTLTFHAHTWNSQDFDMDITTTFDLGQEGVIQHTGTYNVVSNNDGTFSLDAYRVPLVGSCKNVSFSFVVSTTNDPPSFSMDTLLIEYSEEDRR